jgi:hypothetical protein
MNKPVSELLALQKIMDGFDVNPLVKNIARIILENNLAVEYVERKTQWLDDDDYFFDVTCWNKNDHADCHAIPLSIETTNKLKHTLRKAKLKELTNAGL